MQKMSVDVSLQRHPGGQDRALIACDGDRITVTFSHGTDVLESPVLRFDTAASAIKAGGDIAKSGTIDGLPLELEPTMISALGRRIMLFAGDCA
jgi:hypothetical protein